jgi:UrcA family protein
MRFSLVFSAVAATLIAVPVAAEQPVRVGNDSYVVRMKYADLRQPEGRARFLAALQKSATRLCDGVQPARDARACEADVVARAEREAIPQVAKAIRLARTEKEGVELAQR